VTRALLDTHIWLWLQTEPERLGARSLQLVNDPNVELLLSAASAWEIGIKHALGRLSLPEPADAYVPDRCRRSGVAELPISMSHALRAAALPLHHKDPFDRLIVAQAQALDIALITVDDAIASYNVDIVGD